MEQCDLFKLYLVSSLKYHKGAFRLEKYVVPDRVH